MSSRSRNRELCCYQGIPGPSMDDHMTDSELHAWEVGEQTLEPFSGSFHPSALPSERIRTNKRKDHLCMQLAQHLLKMAPTQSTKPAAHNPTDDNRIDHLLT